MNLMYMELKAIADTYPENILLVWVLDPDYFAEALDVVEDLDDEDGVERLIAECKIAFYISAQEGFYTGEPVSRVEDLLYSDMLFCSMYEDDDGQMYVFYKENHDN